MAKVSHRTDSSSLRELITKLKADYPMFKFKVGKQENWSAENMTITYRQKADYKELKYGLLHELAHAILEHKNYSSDFELLVMESQAWSLAAKIGRKYGIKINDDHIQSCLDTYRDWLYKRSHCPNCGVHSIQQDPGHYRCINCDAVWSVTTERFVRPYRLAKLKNALRIK